VKQYFLTGSPITYSVELRQAIGTLDDVQYILFEASRARRIRGAIPSPRFNANEYLSLSVDVIDI
jgi:hypothetical protein